MPNIIYKSVDLRTCCYKR